MKFKELSEEQKKSEVMNYIAMEKGITAPEMVEHEMGQLAAICPPPTATQMGAVTDIDKAYLTMLIQTNQYSADGSTSVAPTDTESSVSMGTKPTISVDPAEQKRVAGMLNEQNASRSQVSNSTVITSLIVDRPAADTYYPEGEVADIKESSWKKVLQMLEDQNDGYRVLEDENDANGVKSMTNFNILNEAYKNHTKVAVHRPGITVRPTGYIIKDESKGEGATEEMLTKDEMYAFVTMKTAGYIRARDNNAGVALKRVQSRKVESQGIANSSVVLSVKNADKNKISIEPAKEVIWDDAQNKIGTLKSELQFRVEYYTKKTNSGKPKQKLMRATVEAPVHALQPRAGFERIAHTTKTDAEKKLIEVTKKDAQTYQANLSLAIAQLLEKDSNYALTDQDQVVKDNYGDILASFRGTAEELPQ